MDFWCNRMHGRTIAPHVFHTQYLGLYTRISCAVLTRISCAYTYFMRSPHKGVRFFYCLQHNVFAVSEVVIHAFSRPRNGRTDRQTGGQSTGQTRLLNPAVRMRTVKSLGNRHLGYPGRQ